MTTNPLAPALDAASSDDFDIAPATALATTIPAGSAVATADVDYVTKTYVGKINSFSIDPDEEFVALRVTLGASAGADWGFVGMRIWYTKAAS